MSAKKARYCIGELSTLCNIPQKTLRYYDEIGLFTPDYRDDSTHYRYYSKSQIVNLMIIKTLKQMGFPLKISGRSYPRTMLSPLRRISIHILKRCGMIS